MNSTTMCAELSTKLLKYTRPGVSIDADLLFCFLIQGLRSWMSCGLPVAPHVITHRAGHSLQPSPTETVSPGTTVSDSFTWHNCLVLQLPNSGEIRTPAPSSGGFRTLRGLRASDCRPRSQLASESGPKARRASECRPAAPVVSEPRPAARRATTSRQKVRNRTRFYRAAAKSPAPRGHRASHASGASDRNRTRNPLITNQLLYR